MAFTSHHQGGNTDVQEPSLALGNLPGCWHHLVLALVRPLLQKQQRMFQGFSEDTLTFIPKNPLEISGRQLLGEVERQVF